ncbi:DUF3999 domain-containing protein [Thermomonas sp. HDW16]|uniref:DUF3999 domain-containing protein n=1 Tax=Thermomonas sp. HDW16 TaxID=2714945 RepID=UPI0014077278|nr:DUF3999 domain-containing protein [Thermomonas sp. HDW16]QIL19925.1 DUF3999 domain-containing protein [Thermomonas sp. HDW16]
MKRIGKNRFFLFAMTMSLAASAVVPADYATQWPLTLGRDDGGAYRVVLDASVYRQTQDPQLRDLVVLDHDSAAVPAALFAPQDALAKPAARIAVPWFALPAVRNDGGAQGWELVSQVDADGRLRRVEARITDEAATALARTALLVDISRVREAIVALELQWQPLDALDLGYRVEASDDLEHWQPLATRGRMVDLQRDGRRLLHRRIELYGLLPQYQKARYLRLTPDRSDQPVAITGVLAELAVARTAVAPEWIELAGRRADAGSDVAFEFELDGRFPVQLADVTLTGNHAVEWRLESRDDGDVPWRLRTGPWMAYRVDAAGVGGSSPAQALGGNVRDRYWRLHANTAVAEAPKLRLGYRPETVVFLAQGSAPYALAAGSARAHRTDAPVPQLVAELRRLHGEEWQPSPAYLGTAKPLAGEAALKPAYDWKSWLLWAVLVLGALVVAGFAFSLLRGKSTG